MLDNISLLSKFIDWGTYEQSDCHAFISDDLSGLLSISKLPLDGLKRQSIWFAVVVLPLPVFPIKAIFWPIGIFIFIFFRAKFLVFGYW